MGNSIVSDRLTITGVVATTPRHIATSEGLAITSFRVATKPQRLNASDEVLSAAETNWYTVTAFHGLAVTAAKRLKKGDRIIASGLLRIRDWSQGERAGTTVEIEADSIGLELAHDVPDDYLLANATADDVDGDAA